MSLSHFAKAPAPTYEYIGMTIVRRLYAVCALVVLSGCGPTWNHESFDEQFSDDPRSSALIAQDIFETEHGTLRAQCVSDAKLAVFVPMDPGALGVQCGTERNAAAACFYQYDIHGPRFAIESDLADNKATQVHEFLHYMLQCNALDAHAADPLHTDSVWLHLDDAAQYMGSTARQRQPHEADE